MDFWLFLTVKNIMFAFIKRTLRTFLTFFFTSASSLVSTERSYRNSSFCSWWLLGEGERSTYKNTQTKNANNQVSQKRVLLQQRNLLCLLRDASLYMFQIYLSGGWPPDIGKWKKNGRQSVEDRVSIGSVCLSPHSREKLWELNFYSPFSFLSISLWKKKTFQRCYLLSANLLVLVGFSG